MKHFLFALSVAVLASGPALATVANGGFESGTPSDGAGTGFGCAVTMRLAGVLQ